MTARCGTALALWISVLTAADVTPDPKLRANHNTYHPAVELLKEKRAAVTDEQLEILKNSPIESIWSAVTSAGYPNCYVAGFHSTRPGERLAGRALTIRYLPRRPDLDEAMQKLAKEGDWPPAYNVRAAEEAKPGDVIVVDLGGEVADGVFFGDISALGVQMVGARGAILYGATRDYEELKDMAGFPVLAKAFDPSAAKQVGVDWNVPIRVGKATVLPGDVVVADAEGIVFFPPSIAPTIIEQVTVRTELEEYERKLTREKKARFRDIYPLSPELRKEYETQHGNKK
jgi:regulator of RNase E activity RraA